MTQFRRLIAAFLAILMLGLALTSCFSSVTTPAVTEGDSPATTAPDSSGKTPDSSTPTTTKPSTPNTTKPSTPVEDPDWLSGYLEKMPTFTINTENGAPITSKEVYQNGTITVDTEEDAYNMDKAVIEIRGRGNYTWSGTEKKSYRIKFAEKTNLLGQGDGPARSWTLLAVHCDQSMLRTAAALTLADRLSGIDYSSSVRFAHLYLNGDYLGVYQVSEQMQVQKYRVNVDDTVTEGEEIGFLVELDTQASEFPVTDGFGNKYEIKSDVWNDDQYVYIADTLNIAYESITTGERDYIEELIDLDSVVDAYIVEELFKNLDVGWGSFYMYQEIGGKLHFGPLWDFDLSAGNADANDNDPNFPMPQYIYVGSGDYRYSQSHPWFIELMRFEWFQKLCKERWLEILDIVNEVPNYVRRVGTLYSADFDKNFERWPIFGHKINREPAQVRALKSHDEHVEYVAKWLETRIAWLTDYANGKVGALPGAPGEFMGSGGTGTASDPYLVSNEKDFYDFTAAMLYGETFEGKYFKQTADLDMAGYIGYTGIGKPYVFAGFYNGNGYQVNVAIESEDGCVFPYVTGTVVNVMTTGTVTNGAQAAGIARSVRRGGAIVNCASYVKVTSYRQAAAGITASNQEGGGIVSGCFFGGELVCESTGAINIFIDGRGGEFSYNYCLTANVGTSVGNETAVDGAQELHTTLNQNLTKLSGGVDASVLCSWRQGEGGRLALTHK